MNTDEILALLGTKYLSQIILKNGMFTVVVMETPTTIKFGFKPTFEEAAKIALGLV